MQASTEKNIKGNKRIVWCFNPSAFALQHQEKDKKEDSDNGNEVIDSGISTSFSPSCGISH